MNPFTTLRTRSRCLPFGPLMVKSRERVIIIESSLFGLIKNHFCVDFVPPGDHKLINDNGHYKQVSILWREFRRFSAIPKLIHFPIKNVKEIPKLFRKELPLSLIDLDYK